MQLTMVELSLMAAHLYRLTARLRDQRRWLSAGQARRRGAAGTSGQEKLGGYAKRLAAEKRAGGSGWDTIKWKQNLYELMNIEIARSNYAMLMERTLPPMAA